MKTAKTISYRAGGSLDSAIYIGSNSADERIYVVLVDNGETAVQRYCVARYTEGCHERGNGFYTSDYDAARRRMFKVSYERYRSDQKV